MPIQSEKVRTGTSPVPYVTRNRKSVIIQGSLDKQSGLPLIKVRVKGKKGTSKPFNALIDTGANVSFINPKIAEQLGLEPADGDFTIWDTQRGNSVNQKGYKMELYVKGLDTPHFIGECIELRYLMPEYDMVLGTYFLARFKFTLYGNTKIFTLEYLDNGWSVIND